MLRFEQVLISREARGLCDESSKTFHTVYAGEIEFGHYFRVSSLSGEFWRWSIRFPIAAAVIGEATTEAEARATFCRYYDMMLMRIGLHEQPKAVSVY